MGHYVRSTISCTSLALGWDSNPCVLKDPTPCVPVPVYCHSGYCYKGPLCGRGLQSLLSFEWLFAFFPQHSRERIALSNCTWELAMEPRLVPLLPRCLSRAEKASQLEIGSFSVFSIPWFVVFLLSKYNPTLPQPLLSITFVSPQKGIPPLHAYTALFLSPGSQSSTYGPPSCPCGPLEMFLSLHCPDSWNFQSSGLNTAVLEG